MCIRDSLSTAERVEQTKAAGVLHENVATAGAPDDLGLAVLVFVIIIECRDLTSRLSVPQRHGATVGPADHEPAVRALYEPFDAALFFAEHRDKRALIYVPQTCRGKARIAIAIDVVQAQGCLLYTSKEFRRYLHSCGLVGLGMSLSPSSWKGT